MSNLNPIQLERYVIYLDSLVLIKIDEQDPRFYTLLYLDGETLKLPRSFEPQISSMLPSGFLPYTEMWINDTFIYYFNVTWEIKKDSQVLITKVRNFGEVREYGTYDDLQDLMATRLTRSSGSLINSPDEINQAITEQVTPVVSQVVQQTIQTTVTPIVNQSVSTALTEQLNITSLDDFFNNQLNAEG